MGRDYSFRRVAGWPMSEGLTVTALDAVLAVPRLRSGCVGIAGLGGLGSHEPFAQMIDLGDGQARRAIDQGIE